MFESTTWNETIKFPMVLNKGQTLTIKLIKHSGNGSKNEIELINYVNLENVAYEIDTITIKGQKYYEGSFEGLKRIFDIKKAPQKYRGHP